MTTFRQAYDKADPAGKAAMQIGSVPIVWDSGVKVSVVIAALNEGPDLEAMVALIAASKTPPSEVIVVDDGSREPVAPRLEPYKARLNITVIRNEARTGSGRAKSQGCDAASGDLIVACDSHLRPPWNWIETITEAFRQWPYSVLCPYSKRFAHDAKFTGYGAKWIPAKGGYWDATWNDRLGPDPATGTRIGCVLGACYIFGRAMMRHLGGYNPLHRGWGAEQEGFSLRAYMAGFDCRLIAMPMPHHYASEDHKPDRTDASCSVNADGLGAWYNRHVLMMTVWDDGRYESVYGPLMRSHNEKPELMAMLAESADAIKAHRVHVQSIRRRSDADIGFLLGIPHPATPLQYTHFESMYGRRPTKACPPKTAPAAV